MLAQPRQKRKICVDPQNLKWKNDKTKFGHKMMEKMGWQQGKGLGANEQGQTDNLKLKANYTQAGFKAKSEKTNYDETWLSHHDEFSSLLGNLKSKKAEPEVEESDDDEAELLPKKEKQSIEEQMRSSNKRFFYKKVLMKDLSRYTEKDKSAVIGIRKNKVLKEQTPELEISEVDIAAKERVIKSDMSVNDYFATKMAAFYAKKQAPKNEVKEEEVEQSPENSEEEERMRRKADRKARKLAAAEELQEVPEEPIERKKKRKEKLAD